MVNIHKQNHVKLHSCDTILYLPVWTLSEKMNHISSNNSSSSSILIKESDW